MKQTIKIKQIDVITGKEREVEEEIEIVEPTEQEILNQKINEATAYLASTEWVENYKLKHDLKLDLIPEDSTKWEKINKREDYKTFLRELK